MPNSSRSDSMTDPNIFTVGGTVHVEEGIYIRREADEQLLTSCRKRVFASVLSPRQMGKSSLMVRTAAQLEPEGYRTVIVDLEVVGVQASAEEWYLGLLDEIGHQLGLDTNVVTWWQANTHHGFTQRVYTFFREVLLAEIS